MRVRGTAALALLVLALCSSAPPSLLAPAWASSLASPAGFITTLVKDEAPHIRWAWVVVFLAAGALPGRRDANALDKAEPKADPALPTSLHAGNGLPSTCWPAFRR